MRLGLLTGLGAMYPTVRKCLDDLRSDRRLIRLHSKSFTESKERFLKHTLEQNRDLDFTKQLDVVQFFPERSASTSDQPSAWNVTGVLRSLFTSSPKQSSEPQIPDIDDARFLRMVSSELVKTYPALEEVASMAISEAHSHFFNFINKQTRSLAQQFEDLQRQKCKRELNQERDNFHEETLRRSRTKFIASVNAIMPGEQEQSVLPVLF